MWKEIPPFSFSAGERKIMAHFVVEYPAGRSSTDVDTSIASSDTSIAVFRLNRAPALAGASCSGFRPTGVVECNVPWAHRWGFTVCFT